MTKTLIALIACVLATSSAVAQVRSYSEDELMDLLRENKPILLSILNAKDPDSLSAFYHSLPHSDQATDLLCAIKLVTLRGSTSDEEFLLEAMPDSKIELFYVGRLDDHVFESRALDTTINYTFQKAWHLWPQALLHHTKYMRKYFKLGDLVEGYFADDYSFGCAWLMEQDCVTFFKILATCHPDIQDTIVSLLKYGEASTDTLKTHAKRIPLKFLESFGVK